MPVQPPSVQRLPGQGATFLKQPAQKAYVFQAYPAMRYHPDGRELVVRHEDEDHALAPASEGWSSKRFPPKPKAAQAPEKPTAEQLADAHKQLMAAHSRLLAEHADLAEELRQSQECCAEKVAEIQELHQKLAQALSQIPAAEPAEDEPVVTEAPVEKGKKKR